MIDYTTQWIRDEVGLLDLVLSGVILVPERSNYIVVIVQARLSNDFLAHFAKVNELLAEHLLKQLIILFEFIDAHITLIPHKLVNLPSKIILLRELVLIDICWSTHQLDCDDGACTRHVRVEQTLLVALVLRERQLFAIKVADMFAFQGLDEII